MSARTVAALCVCVCACVVLTCASLSSGRRGQGECTLNGAVTLALMKGGEKEPPSLHKTSRERIKMKSVWSLSVAPDIIRCENNYWIIAH